MPQPTRRRTRATPPPIPRVPLQADATDGRRRVVVERVRPEVDAGRFPIKRVVGESVRVTAWIHADSHDVLAAVLRYRAAPGGRHRAEWLEREMQALGNDEWAATFTVDRQTTYEYTVHAWVDGFESWRHNLEVKVAAGREVSSELLQGAVLIRAIAGRARDERATDDARWLDAEADRVGGSADERDRTRAALDERLAGVARRFPDRSHAAAYARVLTVSVDRARARCGAWYEMFPRSWGPDPGRSATFQEAAAHLRRVAAMGFDVVYLPPIHPIGTSFRKGRGNALVAGDGDPGSPWAIGSEAGGHKAIEPGLGTLDDFAHFVAEARRLGLEVALDLAFQCSPDHPYVREHPEWFRHRPDGTIQYAENPPKKYQDIYPFDFDSDVWPALWAELKSIVEFWIAHGVLIFRVDNPHTKPYAFWEWLIRAIKTEHPDVLFLSEAFTRPKVMYYLAKLGFTQSYTYVTWRNTKEELTGYLTELTTTEVAEFFRPNLFANTPDILHQYLQDGGRPAFAIRLILVATLGATYGIYSGFELCENRAVPGTEEYLDSEKYRYRAWDWDRPGHVKDLVTAVNGIRRENPALHANDSLIFCDTDNPQLIAFCKYTPDGSNAILVIVNLDFVHLQHGFVQVPLERLGLPQAADYDVIDLLDGARYTFHGASNYIRLDPRVSAAHIFRMPVAPPEVMRRTTEALAPFLARQRWFAGKARTVARAQIVDWSPAGALPGLLMATLTGVAYADGRGEHYFTPLALVPDGDRRGAPSPDRTIARAGGVAIADALDDDEACGALLTTLLAGGSTPMRHGQLRATVYRQDGVPAAARVIRSAVEQSNTSVRFGDRAVMKLLRRLEPGTHPELEMSRFLADQRFTRLPPLLASLEYQPPGQESSLLAVLHGFVVNEGTAWDGAVRAAQQVLLQEAPSRPEAPASDFLASAATLGRRTGELHLALAANASDPAFVPQELTAEDVAGIVAQLRLDVKDALALLTARLPSLPATARDHARAVLDARAVLEAHIATFASAQAGSWRTRVHGDYHLGQVLLAGDDVVIIDFEGEPTRSLADRRSKQSPLKDVAGMLRSFSYAAHAALIAIAETRPERPARLEAAARDWEAAVSTVFLTSYLQTVAQTRLVPADRRCTGQWLGAFLLGKALYELQYELATRPHWVDIPLSGILRIVTAPGPLERIP